MSRHLSVSLLALFLAVTGTAPTSAQQPQKPNVVFILADNVGYGDLGSYGGGELRGASAFHA
jgi:arylsulfatase